jgi:putative transcriptional regulator
MQDAARAGELLVATPLLGDPNFRRTVVLVVEHEPGEGTLGVEPWTDLATGPPVVFTGGPVAPTSALALALATSDAEPLGWRSLDGTPGMSRIGLVDLEAPPQVIAAEIISLRVFAGYAGWGSGQLQAEIDEGAWYVLPGEPADPFMADPARLWQAVLRRQGGELALVATYPDDPRLN